MSSVASLAGQSPATEAPAGDSGLAALVLFAAHFRISVQVAQIRHELGLGGAPASARDLARAAKRLDLRSRVLTGRSLAQFAKMPLPAIVEIGTNDFAILAARADDGRVRLIDPLTRKPRDLTQIEFAALWTGTVLNITRRARLGDTDAPFGINWFVAPILRYRIPLLQVLVASFIIQICGLVTPLFFQITVDKVLPHQSYSTLNMIIAGMLVIGAFNVVLQCLRTYILSHTTSRVDVELGAKLFDHLLRLPLAYFETRAAGQTVARVRELETIRAFLTGQGLTSVIDLVFGTILIAVLFLYSPLLTFVVIASIPFYVLIGAFLRPMLRNKVKERFNRGAASNQFLVESVIGAHTIKAAAIEPILRTQWEEKLAAYVRTSFEASMLSSIGQNAIQYVSKFTNAVILFLGAHAVIDGQMTVGALLAFNMIVQQAIQPILRLSQLWQDFQQTQISIERIGDIMNAPPESRSLAQAHLPPTTGAINVRNVVFRYRPGGAEILKNVSLEVKPGQVLGIVGRSGSGKSTFAKLLQRLYTPESGQVLIDGIDISQVDPAWLRRQIGVVLQENFLFHRTVHENIALASPGMARNAVIRVARLAGADEFISTLPLGYDTMIEERGANLSGGQRQRIAIARALATNPRILIFDEATSALDYESERIIQNNMAQIVGGRTVIIIAHRLAAVRQCDRIIAIEDGRISEDGSHDDLLKRSDSVYARLWKMQGGSTAAIAEAGA